VLLLHEKSSHKAAHSISTQRKDKRKARLTPKFISFSAEVNTSGGQTHVLLDNRLQQENEGIEFQETSPKKHASKFTGKQYILMSSRDRTE
jgi:hypothetical protein